MTTTTLPASDLRILTADIRRARTADRDLTAQRVARRYYGAAAQYPTCDRDRANLRAVRALVDQVRDA